VGRRAAVPVRRGRAAGRATRSAICSSPASGSGSGDAVSGLDMVGKLLDVQGRVLPMASVPLDIEADVIGLDPDRPDEVTRRPGPGERRQVPRRAGGAAGARRPARLPRVGGGDPAGRPHRAGARDPGSPSVLVHLLVPETGRGDPHDASASRILTMNLVPADETQPASPRRTTWRSSPSTRPDCGWTPSCATHLRRRRSAPAPGTPPRWGRSWCRRPLRASDGSPRHDVNRLASVYSDVIGH
jgi:hypothetical protein